MTFAPDQVHNSRKKILHLLNVASEQETQKNLSLRDRLYYRVFGVGYIISCIFVLAHMKLEFGEAAEDFFQLESNVEYSINASSRQNVTDSYLHKIVCDILRPMTHKYVGMVIVTISGEDEDISIFGRANLKSNKRPDEETLFEIGSLSKVFTGVLLASEIHGRRLRLQDSLADLLPGSNDFPDIRARQITLERLVTHTAGLPRMLDGTFSASNIWRALTADDPYFGYAEQDLLKIVSRKNLQECSDFRFHYSNVGFGLLGMILSEENGMSYHDVIQAKIAKPLDLKNTGSILSDEQYARIATGYRIYLRFGFYYFAQRSALWNLHNCMAGAGGLSSSGHDMMKFLKALLGRTHTDLTPAFQTVQEIFFSDEDLKIGMGLFHSTLPKSGESIVWHNGGTGGYSSFLGLTANKRFGVVVLNNSSTSVDDIGYRILDALVSSKIPH